MHLQKSPNAWSCLPTAFAMAIGCPVENLIHSVGHDGSRIAWPDLKDPIRRRGFHIQELIAILYVLSYSVTPIEDYARIAPDASAWPCDIDNIFTFDHAINHARGVLTGYTTCGHAVAYDHGIVCDPRGMAYKLSDRIDFHPTCAWIIRKVNCEV